jgi:ribosomal protein S18 acetylase RimI-like enzyme
MERPILTDVSPAGLRAAIEADIVASRIYGGDLPVEPHEDPDAAWMVAPPGDAWRSAVVRAAFAPESADGRIREILATTEARGTWTVWWLAPHHRPADLAERLVTHGFRAVHEVAAMGVDLAVLPERGQLPQGVTIRRVTDDAGVRAYLDVIMTEGPPGAPAPSHAAIELRRRHIAASLKRGSTQVRRVAWVGGRPVATARLSVAGGVAGLYGVLTLPAFRGRGIGRAMTLEALLAGRDAGLRIGALQATDMGYRLYRTLGYEELFRYTLLARRPHGTADPS